MLRNVALLGSLALILGACDRGAGEAVQETAATGTASEAAYDGNLGEIDRTQAGTQLPPLTFEDGEGNVLNLGALDGPVLVNLWATWCAPCVVEMPALDTLSGETEGRLKVLTISQDLRGNEVVGPFFAARDFAHLEQWLDPENELAEALADGGALPVTILFDGQGREVFRVAGGYEWDSEEAIAQVSEALEAMENTP